MLTCFVLIFYIFNYKLLLAVYGIDFSQAIFNVFIFYYANILVSFFFFFFFFFLVTPQGFWDFSSLTKDQTCAPGSGSPES